MLRLTMFRELQNDFLLALSTMSARLCALLQKKPLIRVINVEYFEIVG